MTGLGPTPADPAPPDPPTRPVSPWNLPNALTVLRILLVPVFGMLLLADDGHNAASRFVALAVFLVAMATDRLDGELARRHAQVTTIGKLLDPIADKALVGMAFVGLSLIDVVPWWVTVVVLARELGVTATRLVVIRHGVIAAGRGGKIKTVAQAFAVSLLLVPMWVLPATSVWNNAAYLALVVAVALTVVSGVDYLTQAHALRRGGGRAAGARTRTQRGSE
ncbi:MAG: CDP-diacylglycerol--glycerol-3-phosphate 3-phosphatidyltransferase [Actinomycetales bacterium]|nr:MAG: CDP-diacylglycerol--glycerol-3-phosphate 3-phosphatidyltransferase [Actinomycetales bacterium]